MEACVFGQSGGPTAVINASALGIIEEAKNRGLRVLAMRNGIEGFLREELYDLTDEPESELELLYNTPAAAFGSCRYKMKTPEEDEREYREICRICEKYHIVQFYYIGGNDSMDTCCRINRYMRAAGFPCRVMGVPKTIDNDLPLTDHCPGYGSAAKYIATSVSELYRETKVYQTGTILVLEIMGRDAGWLAASAALAGCLGQGPDQVYLPESPFDVERFLLDAEKTYRDKGSAIVAVSEGVRDAGGRYISSYGSRLSDQIDVFGHRQMGGLAATLAGWMKERTGIKVRGIEFSLLQRCASHCASGRDLAETRAAGREAVRRACAGESGKMIVYTRLPGSEYQIALETAPLDGVANAVRDFPREWITPEGNQVTDEFLRYALPLIQGDAPNITQCGLPRYPRFGWKRA